VYLLLPSDFGVVSALARLIETDFGGDRNRSVICIDAPPKS
jgi:hypothetical protein